MTASSLLNLTERVAAATTAEACIEAFGAALATALGTGAYERWKGGLCPELDPAAGPSVEESRRSGKVSMYQAQPLSNGKRFGLIVPLGMGKSPPDLLVFQRPARFTEEDQAVAALALAFLQSALRAQAAKHELLESQAQLQQSERMKAIGQLAGGVAHDFNNMLMVISAAAEVMSDTLVPEDPCAAHVKLILDSSHRAAELTQKLLALSRKGRSAMKPVDLHEVLGAVREFLAHTIDRRITLQLSLMAGACLVDADSTQLQNALLNICLNARDAMPGGGLLKIASQRVELDAEACKAELSECKPGSYVRLDVRDTGTGMDEQTLEHAFDPFFTTKDPGRGTGLGLSVVLAAIREHGGAVLLESRPGQGTCCSLLLPLIASRRSEVGALAPLSRPSGSCRVLLLDDEPGVCRTAAQLMRQLGHNVQALRSGEKALSHLRVHASGYDLLVLDVMMPHPTGIEVHRALCDDGIVLPTVFVSGYTEQHLLEGIVEGDGIVFLQKPFRQAELASAITRCLETARPGAKAASPA